MGQDLRKHFRLLLVLPRFREPRDFGGLDLGRRLNLQLTSHFFDFRLASHLGGEEAGGSGGVDGARAKGGPISRGGTYLVGEKGPELITASRSGYVNPNGSTGGASIGTLNISAPVTVTGGAADPEAIAQKVARTIEEKVRETFRGVFADAGMRFS